MSTQLIKPNYLVILPPTQHHSFFRNLPPLSVRSVYDFCKDYKAACILTRQPSGKKLECFVARRRQMAMSCGKKTNLPCSSASGHDDPQICGQKIKFSDFVAQQIRCGHNWLSENKLFMFCNSNINKIRTKSQNLQTIGAVLQSPWSKLYFS